MAARLPARTAYVKRFLPVLPAVLLAWLWMGMYRTVTVEEVRGFLNGRVQQLEKLLSQRLTDITARSDRLSELNRSRRLSVDQLQPSEALLTLENGMVGRYIGEIVFFRPLELSPGQMRLIRQGHKVFALRRLDHLTYYFGLFLNLEEPRWLHGLRIADDVVNLRFSAIPVASDRPDFEVDQASGRFFVRHTLTGSCGQLLLDLTISRKDANRAIRDQHALLRDLMLAALALALWGAAMGAGRGWLLLLRLGAGASLLLAVWREISRLTGPDMDWPLAGWELQRIQHLLLLLLFIGVGLLLAERREKRGGRALAFVVFNSSAALAAWLASDLPGRVDFPFADFTFATPYLSLLVSMLLLHLLPVLAGTICLPGKGTATDETRPGGRFKSTWFWTAVQGLLLAGAWALHHPGRLSWSLMAVAFGVLALVRAFWWPRLLVALATAVAITTLMLSGDAAEKRSFLQNSLRPIFTSQSHYAKLVARELVAVINERQLSPQDFFGSNPANLKEIWRNSLAARENIASGIFVLAPDGSRRQEFYNQMPFIPVPLRRGAQFPFWHVEEIPVTLFGRQVPLAIASINVFAGGQHLGSIVIEVLNAPELILKNRDQTTIFTINRRIRGEQLSYVRFDDEGRVLDNPANLNLTGITELLKADGRWAEFRDAGIRYSGFVFRQQEQTVVIFYPDHSAIQIFALFVRIFLLALLLLAIGQLRSLRRVRWAALARSFSVKVFLILVLISMFSALVFTLFSLNTNRNAQKRLNLAAAYKRGRVAQNMVRNLIAETGEISQNQAFLMADVLGVDISVYENGMLQFFSNYRKVIRLQLPAYLHSGIRDTLERKNQPFATEERDDGLHLFFRIPPRTIIRADFSADSVDVSRMLQNQVDFTISLLFIMLIIGLAAARFFRNLILAPIHELNRGMADVERGQLEPLPAIPTEIELKSLYSGFNAMVAGIREQRRSIGEIARMKTMIQLGRRVAHEVKNPLTPIKLSAEQIQLLVHERETNPQWQSQLMQAVRFISEETEHLRKVAYGFLDLSRLDEARCEPFPLVELVAQELNSLRLLYTHVRFELAAGSEEMELTADRTKIKQALRNVVANAIEAIAPAGGWVRVGCRSEGLMAVLTVTDNGRGMNREELKRIDRENYSLKESGVGLGLTIVRHIMELHHGSLDISSEEGRGTTVTMRFTRHAEKS
jgi:signal transduction histidine kinase